MGAVINNSSDLRAEIERLKFSATIQEAAIKERFNSPAAIFHTVTSLFKGSSSAASPGGSMFANQDIVGLISRFVIPFVLNKTIFRSSNFIIKAVVGLLSQKASGFVSEKNITSVWDKIKSFIPKKKMAPGTTAVAYLPAATK